MIYELNLSSLWHWGGDMWFLYCISLLQGIKFNVQQQCRFYDSILININKTSTLMPGELRRFSVSGDIKTKYLSLFITYHLGQQGDFWQSNI